jgi:putative ATP-dependent endonuclease of OLD family
MATKKASPKAAKTTITAEIDPLNESPRPRLHKLTVKNFRAIGSKAVEIELDDIVVLVGPNNAGKSSILRAYEMVMEGEQSSASQLSRDDFPNEIVDPNNLPEVILETIAFDKLPDERFTKKIEGKEEYLVRERWIWSAILEKPKRVGFNFTTNDWDESFPWAPANIAQAQRPKVHRVDAFSNPQVQSDQILGILQDYFIDRLVEEPTTALSGESSEGTADSDAGALPNPIDAGQKKIVHEIQTIRKALLEAAKVEINAVETELGQMMSTVFPDYSISFQSSQDDPDTSFLSGIFKKSNVLKMGPVNGYQSRVELQGSGARRTLLWNTLRLIAERDLKAKSKTKKVKDGKPSTRPHVLLLDEPEICLHPSAIREACKTLYDLPSGGKWQVMVTTHCPIFIDLSRNNTTVIRVERVADGGVDGTTVFRPTELHLSEVERERIKMLNVYDPHVAEFFFGGRTVLVEGDTEFTAFRYICARYPKEYADLHVVKARGKATLVPLIKILNKFSSKYAILHDADTPTITTKKGKVQANPAWSINQSIRDAIGDNLETGKVRLVASITNFESAYLGDSYESEKPYRALEALTADVAKLVLVKQLLDSLLDRAIELPPHAIAWNTIEQINISESACPDNVVSIEDVPKGRPDSLAVIQVAQVGIAAGESNAFTNE